MTNGSINFYLTPTNVRNPQGNNQYKNISIITIFANLIQPGLLSGQSDRGMGGMALPGADEGT